MFWRETIESDGGEAICSSGAEKGNEQKRAGNVSLLTLRAWTQMGIEIKEERIEYKREGAMPFRAVANQTNRRRKARHKENER